jgi:hypothetical protein
LRAIYAGAASLETPRRPTSPFETPRMQNRTWVNFLASKDSVEPPFVGVLVDGGLSTYKVEEVQTVSGRPLPIAPGWQVTRVESLARIPSYPCDLCLQGVGQHLSYTSARDRQRLAGMSLPNAGPLAVVVTVSKSAAWWGLAQDERQTYFRNATSGNEGHVAIGERYASKISRRLYHGRYLPGSEWDFITYFEFAEEHATGFRKLLAALRDRRRNPEWAFVERESEVWMRRT